MVNRHYIVGLALACVSASGCLDRVPLPPDAGVAVDAAVTVDDLAQHQPADFSGPDAAQPLDPLERAGIFTAVGNHVRHIRSVDDGATWTDDKTEFDSSLNGDEYGVRNVFWGHDRFIAFAAKIFTSVDAKTWTEVPKADGQWLASMIYAQGQYVSSGGYGWLATTTTDLGSWVQHPPVADYTAAHHSQRALAHGVVSGVDAYVVVDDNGTIFHSADGKTWLPVSGAPVVPAGNTWGTMFAFGGGVFIGILPSGTSIIRSTDGGATWTASASTLAGVATSVLYAQGHFTAIGWQHAFTSVDGDTWVDHPDVTALDAQLTYGHGVYLEVKNGQIYRSNNGIAFTPAFDNGTNADPVQTITFGPL